jgi:nucleoid-associated protein YgaU
VDTAERAKREQPMKRTKPAAKPRVIAAPAPVVAPATTNVVTVHVAAGVNRNTVVRVSPGDRFHTVHRGESLWSIASDLLGDGTSDARVAREVNRLWELNADRIASGSPDLLFAGTRLRLR